VAVNELPTRIKYSQHINYIMTYQMSYIGL